MFYSMDHVGNSVSYMLVYGLAAILSLYLHEGSHWAVGKLGKTQPTVDWKIMKGVWPDRVRHGRIETMDQEIIRFSGLSIFVWLPPWILSLGYLAAEVTPYTLLVSLVPFLIVFAKATESDVLAIRDPEGFRKFALEDNLPGDPVFNPIVVGGIVFSSFAYFTYPIVLYYIS